MNVYKETRELAQQALKEASGDMDKAQDLLNQMIDGHEVCIYYGKAIQFCADHDTSAGETYLDDCGSFYEKGDTFGKIACRVAYATLWDCALTHLYEMERSAQKEYA